jgi:hypothetical protein
MDSSQDKKNSDKETNSNESDTNLKQKKEIKKYGLSQEEIKDLVEKEKERLKDKLTEMTDDEYDDMYDLRET